MTLGGYWPPSSKVEIADFGGGRIVLPRGFVCIRLCFVTFFWLLFLLHSVRGTNFFHFRAGKFSCRAPSCVSPWRHSIDFVGPKACHGDAIYVVSGKPDFLRHVLATLDGCKRLIVTVDIERCGVLHLILLRAGASGL